MQHAHLGSFRSGCLPQPRRHMLQADCTSICLSCYLADVAAANPVPKGILHNSEAVNNHASISTRVCLLFTTSAC